MSSFRFDVSDFVMRARQVQQEYEQAAIEALEDSTDDLHMIASHIAPIDKNTLRKSGKTKVKKERGSLVGEVTFSVSERGRNGSPFNYALKMHEGFYTPSQEGSYEGYAIGRKYLERPLYQESEKYLKWIADNMREVGGGT